MLASEICPEPGMMLEDPAIVEVWPARRERFANLMPVTPLAKIFAFGNVHTTEVVAALSIIWIVVHCV